MENISLSQVYAVLTFMVACSSIAGFYLGRRKEATAEGRSKGSLETDINYIKQSMDDMKMTVEKLDRKLDESRKESDAQIRELLINYAELNASYKSLHKRVDGLERKLGLNLGGGEE